MLTTHPTCQYWRKDPIKWANELNRDCTMDTFDFLSLTVVGGDGASPKKSDDDDGTGGASTDGDDEKEGSIASSASISDEAWIDFRVHVRNKETGEETVLKEKSLFLKQGDRWLYARGEARPEPVLKSQEKKP